MGWPRSGCQKHGLEFWTPVPCGQNYCRQCVHDRNAARFKGTRATYNRGNAEFQRLSRLGTRAQRGEKWVGELPPASRFSLGPADVLYKRHSVPMMATLSHGEALSGQRKGYQAAYQERQRQKEAKTA